ncbi:MAG: formate dehydrogenase accessory protein FdhE [Gordonibacter sp.]
MNLKAIDAAVAAYSMSADGRDGGRLAFFRKLWEVEAASAADAPAYDPPEFARLREWYEAGEPVLSLSPVAVDGAALAAALERLGACAVAEGGFSPEVVSGLLRVKWNRVVAASPLALAGEAPAAYVEGLAQVLADDGMDDGCLSVALPLVLLALRSQLAGAAAAVAGELDRHGTPEPHALHCPVCGGQAVAAQVGGAGSNQGRGKTLWCGQCGCTWEFERVRCARCGTQNQGHLHYFNIEGDEAHRLATCDECGGYVRTVYAEEVLAPFSFQVEDVVMARLDAIALDPSFAGGMQATDRQS